MLHHLHALRLSGLIQIRMPEADSKQKALFSLRPQAVHDVSSALNTFLHKAGNADAADVKTPATTETEEKSQGG